jgi:hypothetical protein
MITSTRLTRLHSPTSTAMSGVAVRGRLYSG